MGFAEYLLGVGMLSPGAGVHVQTGTVKSPEEVASLSGPLPGQPDQPRVAFSDTGMTSGSSRAAADSS